MADVKCQRYDLWICRSDEQNCNARAISKKFGDVELVIFDDLGAHSHKKANATQKTLRNLSNIPDSQFTVDVTFVATARNSEQLIKGWLSNV